MLKRLTEEGFAAWNDRVLRCVAVGLGEPRLNATNWVAEARALGWVPEAPKVDDGNGRDADEEVNDQIGREADDSKNGRAQASSEIPMEAKKEAPGQGPEGKGEKNNNEAHGSANARERTAKSNGADHEIDDTDADLAVFDHEPELEAAKAPPSAAIARAQAESDAIRKTPTSRSMAAIRRPWLWRQVAPTWQSSF